MAVASKIKLLKAYKEIDLFRAKYRHADFTPYAWCFHGNQKQEWSGECKEERLKITGETTLSMEIDTTMYKHISFYLEMPKNILTEQGEIPRPEGYSYKLYLYFAEETKVIEIKTDTKLVYLDMTDDENWNGLMPNLRIKINLVDKYGREIKDTYPKAIAMMEYFKVDQINVFEEVRKNPTVVAKDINNLRQTALSLNTGFYNEPCNLGDVPNYKKVASSCGNEDLVVYGKKPLAQSSTIDDSLNSQVEAFMDKIKSGDFDTVTMAVRTMDPYNGCSTCDLNTCSCYAVHYGSVACQACDGCDQYNPCRTGCDVGCYSEARTCQCDMGCYTQAIGCTCDGSNYGYIPCTCNARTYFDSAPYTPPTTSTQPTCTCNTVCDFDISTTSSTSSTSSSTSSSECTGCYTPTMLV